MFSYDAAHIAIELRHCQAPDKLEWIRITFGLWSREAAPQRSTIKSMAALGRS